jgi:acyl-CoA synthetase (AMP-forming)/AMP-acid ligase II/acyl carrier protein
MALPNTLVRRLADALDRRGTTPFLFLYDQDGRHRAISYAEVIGRAAAWARRYQALGLPDRSRVVVILEHSLDVYAAFTGALLANLVPSMFAHPSPKQSAHDYVRTLRTLMAGAAPSALVTAPALAERLPALLRDVSPAPALVSPEDVGVDDVDTRMATAEAFASSAASRPEDVAFIQYSSGTTGLKKAVAITHQALLWQIDHYAEAISLSQDDVIASWLPLYHDMGLICCAMLPLVTATPVAALSPFDWVRRPALLLDAVTAHRATLCWLPNFAYNFLAKNVRDEDLARVDLRSLRGLVNCSEPIMAGSHDLFTARFVPHGLRPEALATSYAMAENTFAVTSGGFDAPLVQDIVDARALAAGRAMSVAASHPDAKTLISSGSALPETEARILSDTGVALPDRQIGEISIASPALFGGYEGEPAPAIIGDRFRTGDLGYLADGQLYVTGRKKDLIIVGGKNLFPQDIEAAMQDVAGTIPGRVVAFGVTNETTGSERVVVIAETHETEPGRRTALAAAIRQRVAQGADVAVDDVCLVEHMWLRKSSSGKLARGANRDRYLQLVVARDIHATATTAATPTLAKTAAEPGNLRFAVPVLNIVRRLLGAKVPDGFGPDDPLITSGLIDSLGLATLVLELETTFDLRIPGTSLDVSHFRNVWAITHLLERLASGETRRERIQEANGVQQIDDRDKACARFLEVDRPVDLLLLGSSRARHLSPHVARRHGWRAFNFWLANARAEDWYVAARFVLDHSAAPPRAIVLPLDVEGFSNTADISVRLAYSRHLTPYLRTTDGWNLPGLATPESTPGDHRFASIRNQFKIGQGDPWMMTAWDGAHTDRYVGDTRGDDHRPALTLADPLDRHELYTLRMQGFTALDPRRLRYFDELLRICFDRHIRVIAGLSPLHPALDAFLSETTTYAARLAELIARLDTIRHPLFTFHDTRVPSRFGGSDQDFQDAAHCGPANADRLLDFLLSRGMPQGGTAPDLTADIREPVA